MTLGRHFALTLEDEALLRKCDETKRDDWIGNEVEQRYSEPWFCDTDKAWDAIHRAFTDSTLSYEPVSPLAGVILGGEPLYFESDYIISHKSIRYVGQIVRALAKLDKLTFKNLYFKIDSYQYGFPLTSEDFEYSWEWLAPLQEFYQNAFVSERSVIFTASQ
jgi:Domain of unknown function (DUF1877)